MNHCIQSAGIGVFLAFLLPALHAQDCSFSIDSDPGSGNEYSISISLATNGASTSQAGPSCTYNVNIDYDIQISGTNPPSNLNTLQGTLICYGEEIFFDLPLTAGSGTTQGVTANLDPAICDTMQFNCGGYMIEINGAGITTGEYACVQGTEAESSILPVDLLNFGGKLIEGEVQINWTVANEVNNFGFFIQRSTNGEDWTDIGFQAGKGNEPSQASYQFLDSAPLIGHNYYRLKQMDYNGEVELFSIIAISVESVYSTFRYAFPSPFGNQLTLQGPAEEIIIYDEIGREKVRASSLSSPHSYNVRDWVKGLYIVRAVDPFGHIHYQKLMK